MIINGVKFKHGTVKWEDAVGKAYDYLPNFDLLKDGMEWMGAVNETTGLVAKIGPYIVIITRYDEREKLYDYTLIPFTKAIVKYSRNKS